MAERRCLFCRAPVTACFGFTLARDALAHMLGELPFEDIRELCGRCSDIQANVFGVGLGTDTCQDQRALVIRSARHLGIKPEELG